MKKSLKFILPFAIIFCFTHCATNPPSATQRINSYSQNQHTLPEEQLTPINGPEIGLSSMDSDDKNRMSHALDQGLGKTTDWTNGRTGIHYAVTAVAKTHFQNNAFCRRYQVIAKKNSVEQVATGTACVSSTDATWRVVE